MAVKKIKHDKIKKQLNEYQLEFTKLINIKPQQFDIVRVASMIRATPERKWNAAQALISYTITFKEAQQHLKKVRASAHLRANHARETQALTNAEDRKAYVDNDIHVQNAEVDLINAEADLLTSKMAYECLDDLFTAGKKIMDYLVDQERSTNQYSKYVNEGKRNG